ncbi:MAG TPA: DUF6263 family protein [Flavisolibacter sp.]|nr:DUF6263 family protein [Flavisolibacter sp.]
MKRILVVALAVLSMNSFAQTVPNKISFKKGQKLEVNTQMNRTSAQELMGQSMESSVTSTLTSLFNVEDVADADASIESSVKRVQFNMSLFGREEKFDSDNKDDLNSEIGKMMTKTLNDKYKITVDKTGSVKAVAGQDQQATKKEDDGAAMMGMLVGKLGPTGTPKAGDPTIFKVLPGKEVSKGETWTDEVKVEGGSTKAHYTLADITDSEILIDFTEETQVQTKQEMMGMEAGIKVLAKTKGKIILDKETRLLKQKTFETDSEETISAAGQEMPSKSKMTTTILVISI